MKNKITELLLVVAFANLLSCTEKTNCGPQKTLVKMLDPSVKQRIPYNGFDTLRFVRTNVGDTHTFVGTGIEQGYDLSSITRDPNCLDDKTKTEYNSIEYRTTDMSDVINYEIFYRDYYEAPLLSIKFKGQKYITSFEEAIWTPPYLDSITIQNKVYYNVNFITDFNNSPPTSFYVYYNTKGILKIKLSNGETWELLGQ